MSKDLTVLYYIHVILLCLVAIILWGLALSYSPHLDGVSIYSITSSLPMNNIPNTLPIFRHVNRTENAFIAEASMMPYCVFPAVYNELADIPKASIAAYLQATQKASAYEAGVIYSAWENINFDTWDNPFKIVGQPATQYNMPYNLPYDGLEEGKSLNPQYFSPVCRCINSVLDLYKQRKGTYDSTIESLKACMATRHIIRQQKLVGDDNLMNSDLKSRKYFSRHALLFNLCIAVVFTMFYNRINFDSNDPSTVHFYKKQWTKFLPLALFFLVAFFSQMFSIASSVSAENCMQFSGLVYAPASVIFIFVETLWSFVAKTNDVRRQTYLHPYSFYVILVNLFTIALVENGVFTLEVIITFVFLSNIIALAYAATIFTAHGKLWKLRNVEAEDNGSRLSHGELIGYILILFLVGLSCVFHYIPLHPINTELNYLWMLPMVFVFFCFTQIVVLEHLMGEENDTVEPGKTSTLKFTNSVHLLNLGHTAIIALVILYYAAQLHYTWYGDMSFTQTGGKLDRRLNFELAELLDAPSYNNLADAPGEYFRST